MANSNILAQNLFVLEKKYSSESQNLGVAQNKLDSLKTILDNKATVIDNEKRKQNKDDNKIASLMAGTITLSTQIENQQKRINEIINRFNSIKKELYIAYSGKLDSLFEVQKSRQSISSKEELNRQILSLTERKLLVSPVISSLSYNPGKLASLDVNSAKDPERKSLYREYMENALSEVEDHLKKTDEQLSEIYKIVQLQKKVNNFLDEADFGREFHPSANIKESNTDNTNSIYSNKDPYTEKDGVIKKGISNSLVVLNQLKYLQTSSGFISVSKNNNYTYKEYQRILKEVKKSLLEYKTVLNLKLNFFR